MLCMVYVQKKYFFPFHNSDVDKELSQIPIFWFSVFSFFQKPRMLSLQHISTHNTGLFAWGPTRFTRMPETGQVVIWGKTARDDSPGLHIYNGSSDSWEKDRIKVAFCENTNYINFLLPVTVQQQQLLAVSYFDCEKIRLYNMKTREITTAFHDPRYYPGCMCQGEADQIYVVHSVKGRFPILQLNCSQPQFTLEKTIQSQMEKYYAFCYIPSHRLIVVSDLNLVRAVSCDTEEKVWELKGEVQDTQCNPFGMVYSPDHQALLVADGRNSRVLVVNPGDGSVRQVVQLGADVGCVSELCLHNQLLVVHHTDDGHTHKVSFFSIHIISLLCLT